ncbi:tRNA (adenosine(37)-N6)-threonylcarbamoyltransferase complex ATPase subunit type 1 TsaE [Paraburkholderia tropica]|uniref:tRNA (adenosine(37)-N6)-threonylcarbamoyltransferase complex ATPase subunit type 1 TsaE n=1 Tax=Paraburkholderia tropica TaxID=92647 RepID=UPI000F54AB9C|nr:MULTISPECIES: tRNA (adenosine(37)-N6)-threonylcarbamoyltransferase complex ATPase subunit type 1 TsaE [Paraburkholderia]QNB10564.1 tRNA (adenosine(37)-N6)-threonylcarbamoyltransferase complex ATPase subunit type 1 TsaE [Paraburkholderia tropica]RQM44367.1 tRNA (adenosine(37)-N6)-threonylcarbamoyltransferase complex ATPase subunit type 1 TsaE [Paraburkholderia bannensis]
MPDTPGHDHASLPAAPVLLERRFELADESATDAFGARFAHALDAVRTASTQVSRQPADNTASSARHAAVNAFGGLHVQLLGDLGAGKTSLVRAALRALGHNGRVRSPTYTLVEPYTVASASGELQLYHFDLYRFSDPAEWADAGFREYFAQGAVCLVEWPQRAGGLLGVPDLVFQLEPGPDGEGRVLTAYAYSASGKACLERC